MTENYRQYAPRVIGEPQCRLAELTFAADLWDRNGVVALEEGDELCTATVGWVLALQCLH